MERKTFISVTALGMLGLYLPSWECRLAPSAEEEAMARPEMLSELTGKTEVTSIGLAYLKKFPGYSGQRKLKVLLLSSFDDGNRGKPGSPDEIRRYLSDKVKQDFDQGHILELDGWLISETESRQCALYSLIYS